MNILSTDRLTLREFVVSDAEFLLDVMNQPDYYRFIGDRGVRSVKEAETYIETMMLKDYATNGFGFWVMMLASVPVGFAGLVKRPELPCPDVGYALAGQYTGHGYVDEAVRGILKYNRSTLGFETLQAITDPDNAASINVLTKCGFRFIEKRQVFADDEELNVYEVS